MTASIISICNSALSKLGAERISSLSEQNKRARLCNEQYEKVRDDVLRAHNWNFAIKRVALAVLSTTPVYEYEYEYNLPSDCLKVIEVYPDVPFAIEGRKLLSNSNAIKIKYIYKNEDVYMYDANFLESLALKLAADLAYPLIQSVNKEEQLNSKFKEQLAYTRTLDAQEGTPEESSNDIWLEARYGVNNEQV
jgi:hypothetical protein